MEPRARRLLTNSVAYVRPPGGGLVLCVMCLCCPVWQLLPKRVNLPLRDVKSTLCPSSYIVMCSAGVSVENICENGGTCRNVGNYHMCTCRPGFDGSYCATEINECASQPCQNGATCEDLIGRYHCKCKPGFQVHSHLIPFFLAFAYKIMSLSQFLYPGTQLPVRHR